MRPDSEEEFRAHLDALRRDYIATLPAKSEQLSGAVANGDHDAVRQLVHRLSGTAGSYGLDEISKLANALDARFAAGESVAELTERIDELCSRLVQAV